MKKSIVIVFLGLITIVIAGCNFGFALRTSSHIQVFVKPPLSISNSNTSSRAVLQIAEQSISVKAEAEEMETISKNLSFDSEKSLYSGSISVEKGKKITFTVEAKDVNGNVYVSGKQTKLMAKDNETIAITLAPVLDKVKKTTDLSYQSELAKVDKGTVTSVIFAPNIEEKTSFTCNADDLAYVFCDRQGKILSIEDNTLNMEKGEEIIILFAKAGEHSSFSISLTNTPKYTISYNANGGSGTMTAQTVESDTPISISPNNFTRKGYTFAGWSTNPNGGETSYLDKGNITLTENITLYAQWTQNPPSVNITVEIGADGNLTVTGADDELNMQSTLRIIIEPDEDVEISNQRWILVDQEVLEDEDDDEDPNTISISLEGYENVLSLGDNVLTFYYTCNGVSHTELIRFTINAN